MEKITITIDLNKIDKERIFERSYEKDGKQIIVNEYKMDIVPLKNKKSIKKGDTWELVKSHFVCESQTKEERENRKETVFLGEGTVFENPKENQKESSVIDVSGIPF